jgi:hypothetical protein
VADAIAVVIVDAPRDVYSDFGKKLSVIGINTRPCTQPSTIVSQTHLKNVNIIYASTLYSIDMPTIVDDAP